MASHLHALNVVRGSTLMVAGNVGGAERSASPGLHSSNKGSELTAGPSAAPTGPRQLNPNVMFIGDNEQITVYRIVRR